MCVVSARRRVAVVARSCRRSRGTTQRSCSGAAQAGGSILSQIAPRRFNECIRQC